MSKLSDFYHRNKPVIRFALLLTGLLFILFLLKSNWPSIKDLLMEMDIAVFAISVVIGLFGMIVSAIYFKKLLAKHGTDAPALLVIKMHMVGQIAKYIPGKIWGMAYQISHMSDINSAKSIIIANMEMMLGMMMLTSLFSGSILAYLFVPALSPVVFLAGALLFLVFYKTNFVDIVLSSISKKFRALYRSDQTNTPSGEHDLGDSMSIYCLFSIGYVLSNLLLLMAVFHFSIEQSLIYIVLLSIAWLGGALAIVIPAGMGVREIIFVALSSYINPDVSLELLASIAVISRFWQILQEILGMFISFLIQPKKDLSAK